MVPNWCDILWKIDRLTSTFIVVSASVTFVLFAPIISMIISISPNDLLSVVRDPEVVLSIFLSFLTATITTILAILLGVPLAYLLVRYEFKFREILDSIIDLPVMLPHTVAGIALLTVFGPRTPIGSTLKNFGLVFTGTIWGIIAAQFFVSTPLLVKTVKEALSEINLNLLNVARTLGADRRKVFFEIELPLIKNGILTGAILTWSRAISEFGAVIILAYYPPTAPVMIFVELQNYGLKPALAISVLLAISTFTVFIALKLVEKRRVAPIA